MPKRAICPAKLAEASLVVWAVLLGIRFSRDRMPKDTGVLLIALTELDEKCADRHFLGIEPMQVPTLITFLARVAIPMDAHF